MTLLILGIIIAHRREYLLQILLDLGVLIALLQIHVPIIRLRQNHALQQEIMCGDSLLSTLIDYCLVSGDCLVSYLSLDTLKMKKCHLRGFLPHLGPSSELLLKFVPGGDRIFQHGGD